jgi:hypothetical protein
MLLNVDSATLLSQQLPLRLMLAVIPNVRRRARYSCAVYVDPRSV